MSDIRSYQELAAKICEVACADYIDALIIKQDGYLDKEKTIAWLFRKVIECGSRRYVWKDKKGFHVQTSGRNLARYKHLLEMVNGEAARIRAEDDIKVIEEYFYSPLFAVSMPNTDPGALIALLKQKAENGERMNIGYPTLY